MAEFVEIMKQKKRMCESHDEHCSFCEILKSCGTMTCREYCMVFPQEAEKLIMTWAKKHPLITNADKFKEVFGIEPSGNHCPQCFCNEQECVTCSGNKFWSQEYKEPKEV